MLFPILQLEKAVQTNDKTRFDATKSFVTKGSTTFTTMVITPGVGETDVSIMDNDPKNWYLDWKFSSAKMDVDSTNNKIDIVVGSTTYAATVSSGSYTMSLLAAAVKTALDALGVGTFTVSLDQYEEATISTTVAFSLKPEDGVNKDTSILPHIGFTKNTGSSKSVEGSIIDGLTRKITLTAGDGSTTQTESQYIKILSPEGDALFSNDADLQSHESDVLKYVPEGRSSFKNMHRRAQELIIAWLDEQGYTNIYGDKFNKFDIVDKEEVRQWSTAMVLKIIYRDLSNAVDDVFAQKAKDFSVQEIVHRNRSVIRLDINKDKKVDLHEETDGWSGMVVRR